MREGAQRRAGGRIEAPSGWTASGVHAGTKPEGRLDLALLLSDRPASVAAAFTTNKAVCAHILVCRPRVARGTTRGVAVSAGIANAGTGRSGIDHAAGMAAAAAEACGVRADDMLVCTTGRIGPAMPPVSEMAHGISLAAKSLARDGVADAARAIWTTDTKLKVASRDVGGASVVGFAKGAAMIAPQMRVAHATMLAFVATDAGASPAWLRATLGDALPTTFNAISVDGSMSTNDTVLLFANGASGVDADNSTQFAAAVREVMGDLAYAIASDGEGSTKVIRIRVTGAASNADAVAASRAVADSILFRSAVWAGEAKWGWVVQQIGQAPIELDPDKIRVTICGVELAAGGIGTGRQDEANQAARDATEVLVEADLGLASGSFEYLTCDISPDYPKSQLGT